MTKQEDEALIAALLEERRGYANHGKEERVKQVDAQLKLLGALPEKPSKKRASRSRARVKRLPAQ